MARTRMSSKRRKTAALEFALFDADILASIAPYLVAADLANLSSTCRHFGVGSRGGHGDDDASLPLVQEAARRAILSEQSKTEKAALARYPGESWLSMYDRLLLLRAPLIFDRFVGRKGLAYEDGNKSRVGAWRSDAHPRAAMHPKSAISSHIMRRGKHYAEFFRVQGYSVSAGLMRPIHSGCWGRLEKLDYLHPAYAGSDEVRQAFLQGRSKRWGESNTNCCMFGFDSGRCICNDWGSNHHPEQLTWEGQEHFERHVRDEGGGFSYVGGYFGVLGLLLDLDAGTLTAYKDGRRLGIMRDGLAGEYCWVASIYEGAISIKRGAVPDDA